MNIGKITFQNGKYECKTIKKITNKKEYEQFLKQNKEPAYYFFKGDGCPKWETLANQGHSSGARIRLYTAEDKSKKLMDLLFEEDKKKISDLIFGIVNRGKRGESYQTDIWFSYSKKNEDDLKKNIDSLLKKDKNNKNDNIKLKFGRAEIYSSNMELKFLGKKKEYVASEHKKSKYDWNDLTDEIPFTLQELFMYWDDISEEEANKIVDNINKKHNTKHNIKRENVWKNRKTFDFEQSNFAPPKRTRRIPIKLIPKKTKKTKNKNICRFYQQGYCRFEKRCNFDHIN